MGSCPIQYITAHLARIHGINWSHQHETLLTTSSQDGTVKYFDINNPRRAERIITNSSPVWRARYTPFADGLVTVIVPHLGRGVNSLLLWNNSQQSTPICSFVGHTDVVLDFAWRPNRKNDSPDMVGCRLSLLFASDNHNRFFLGTDHLVSGSNRSCVEHR